MYESDDDITMLEGDVCGDYDLPETPERWTIKDFDDILPVWWVKAEDCCLFSA